MSILTLVLLAIAALLYAGTGLLVVSMCIAAARADAAWERAMDTLDEESAA